MNEFVETYISKVLKNHGVNKVTNIDKFNDLGKDERFYFVKNNEGVIRINSHFESESDFIIIDSMVCTVGIIYVLNKDVKKDKNYISKFIDEAAYLRHLLLTHSIGIEKNKFTVEVIFVIHEEDLASTGAQLRELVRDTAFLNAVNVNTIILNDSNSKSPKFDQASVKRAFCWLLKETKNWYGNTNAKQNKLKSIRLDNYRLSGRRELQLDDKSTIHIVHGYNGSGKSSLIEALEYIITGRIDRLGELDDYHSVLINLGKEFASIDIETTSVSNPKWTCKLVKDDANKSEFINPQLKASSFRIDQQVMNKLSNCGDFDRAVFLLDSFFPQKIELFANLNKVKSDLTNLYEKNSSLLDTIRELNEKSVKRFRNAYGFIQSEDEILEQEKIEMFLPLPLNVLEKVSIYDENINETLNGLKSTSLKMKDFEQRLQEVDSAIKKIKTSGNIERIIEKFEKVLNILSSCKKQSAAKTVTIEESYSELLDEWLTYKTLADSSDKLLKGILPSFNANKEGWRCPHIKGTEKLLEISNLEDYIEDLRKLKHDWITKECEIQEKVFSLYESKKNR